MSIYSDSSSGILSTRDNYLNWHRTDFFTELVRESTGHGANIGASGDAILSNANFQSSATVTQVQKSTDGTNAASNKLQGVQVTNIQPVNGDVLTFDSTLNAWTPEPGATGTITGTGVGGQIAVFTGPSSIGGFVGFQWDNINSIMFVPGSVDLLGVVPSGVSSANHGRLVFNSGDERFQVSENGNAFRDVMSAGAVTHTATAGADTLPTNPAGFVTVNISGADVKIPFYNP